MICAWCHEKLGENAWVDQASRVIYVLISQQVEGPDAGESWRKRGQFLHARGRAVPCGAVALPDVPPSNAIHPALFDAGVQINVPMWAGIGATCRSVRAAGKRSILGIKANQN